MTAEFQEDVDGLTLGQCVDHPKWPGLWLVTSFNYGARFGIFDASHQAHVIDNDLALMSPAAAARAALKTLLPPRPPVVVVTEEDLELADTIGRSWFKSPVMGMAEFARTEIASLIAAYRTKHAGAKSG